VCTFEIYNTTLGWAGKKGKMGKSGEEKCERAAGKTKQSQAAKNVFHSVRRVPRGSIRPGSQPAS